MSFLLQAAAAIVLAGLTVLLVAVGLFFAARREVRRRWRRAQSRLAGRGVMAGASALAAWRQHQRTGTTADASSRGPAARVRRQMWSAIAEAEEAVQHADSLNGAVAELPAVCRSLRRVGTELDQLLRLEARAPSGAGGTVRTQVTEVIQTARQVQAAGLRAGADATEPQIRAMLRDARDEVDIVAAARSRLRSNISY